MASVLCVLLRTPRKKLGVLHLDRSPWQKQFTKEDLAILRSQSVISRSGHGGRRTAPYAFTEQGVAMLSSVLHSPRAIDVNIEIMRAFVRLRRLLATHKFPS